MRVVMIGPFAWSPKGTVNSRTFLIGRALVQRGHEATILMPPYDNPRDSGYETVRDGVQLINVALPSWGDSLWSRMTVPLAMTLRVRRLAPDLVHVFKPVGYSGFSALYVRLLMPSLPLVIDSDDWEGRGGWADIKPYPLHWRLILEWQERSAIRRADFVTVASRTLETRLWSLGVNPERVAYFPNGPSPTYREFRQGPGSGIHSSRTLLGASDGPLAIYVGHISYGSEVSLVVEALPDVLQVFRDFRVVIVGSGDGVPQLQDLARRAGVAQHVEFVGWVAHEQTPTYLNAADLALYPYRDTLVNRAKSPSKITAYMAMGKPIVASAVGEIVEYLDGGRAGLLVEPGDAHAFGKGMMTLLRDPARAAELGRRAESRIWKEYDWARQVQRLEEIYSSLITKTI